jgi:hypothetical protein
MEEDGAIASIISFMHQREAHIMYLTVSSSYLISFVMGGGGGRGSGLSRVIKFLYSPERPEQGDYRKFLYLPPPPPPQYGP